MRIRYGVGCGYSKEKEEWVQRKPAAQCTSLHSSGRQYIDPRREAYERGYRSGRGVARRFIESKIKIGYRKLSEEHQSKHEDSGTNGYFDGWNDMIDESVVNGTQLDSKPANPPLHYEMEFPS